MASPWFSRTGATCLRRVRSALTPAATARPGAKGTIRRCCRGRTATISTCSRIMRSATPSSCSSRPSSSASTRSAKLRPRPSSRAARSTASASASGSTIRSSPRRSGRHHQFAARPIIRGRVFRRRSVRRSARAISPTSPTARSACRSRDSSWISACATNLPQRDTYRAVVGLRGTFNDDWTYEISANYGRDNEATTILGNVDIARLLFAMDAGRNPATGQIQCRAQFDPTAQIDVIGDATKLAGDIAACVPYNPIGSGTNNEAARQYIVRDTISHAHLDQLVLSAFMSGDFEPVVQLAGRPGRVRDRRRISAGEIVLPGRSVHRAAGSPSTTPCRPSARLRSR